MSMKKRLAPANQFIQQNLRNQRHACFDRRSEKQAWAIGAAPLDQSHCFLLEFERVSRSCRFRHFRSPCVNLNTQQGIRFSRARSHILTADGKLGSYLSHVM
jgi:hypothetical protein